MTDAMDIAAALGCLVALGIAVTTALWTARNDPDRETRRLREWGRR